MVWLRAQLVQFADAVRLPILWAVFRDPAAVGDSAVAISCWLFALGLFAPWVGVANKAIIAECAPPAVLGSAVAMNAALEGVFSALFGGPLVGWLSEAVFGYKLPPLGVTVAEMEEELRAHNAEALGQALLFMTAVPWVICLALYTLIHLTYPKECAASRGGSVRT